MKGSIIGYTGWLLIAAAFGFYGYGIEEAIRLSWPTGLNKEDIPFPVVLSTTSSSLQALLLTNLGILLGISVSNPNSALAKQLMLSKGILKTGVQQNIPPPLELREKVQLFALVIYVLGLIACLLTWIRNDFSTNPKEVVAIIPEAGKMFVGVVLAYVTTILGK